MFQSVKAGLGAVGTLGREDACTESELKFLTG